MISRRDGGAQPGPAPEAPGVEHASPLPARVHRTALLILAAGATYLLLRFLWPFLPAIVTSAVLAVLVAPANRRLERAIGNRGVAALLGTGIAFFLVLLPLVALSVLLLGQLPERTAWLAGRAVELVAPDGRASVLLDRVVGWSGIEPHALAGAALQQLDALAGFLASRTLHLLSGIGGGLLQAGAALFTLYYFLRDADGILDSLRWLAPLERGTTDELLRRAREVTFATVYGNVVIAVVQGVVGGLVFWMLGVPAAVMWGTVMGLLGLLPVIGPPLVWLPAAAMLLLSGQAARGVLLLILGGVLISGIDNVIRPLVISGRTQLHPLVVFFSVLGGIVVFGAVGLFVGPVLFVAALSVIEMARLAVDPGGGRPASAGLLLQKGPGSRRWFGVGRGVAAPVAGAAPGSAPEAPEP